MIKEIFQYAFDVIRNFSLIIVVVQIIALLAILNMEHTRESMIDEIYDWEHPGYLASASVSKKGKNTTPNNLFAPRLEINTQSGKAFLYPAEISYVEASPCEIHTIYGHSIQTTETFNNLANRILDKNNRIFYKTRSFLYNTNQIVHVFSKPADKGNSYKDYAELKNNDTIPVPKGEHKNSIINKIFLENN